MAPLPLSSQTAPEGMRDAFQRCSAIPLFLLLLWLCVCVLVIEQQSDGYARTNLGFGQQITLKTHWMAGEDQPPPRGGSLSSDVQKKNPSSLLSTEPLHEDQPLYEKAVCGFLS